MTSPFEYINAHQNETKRLLGIDYQHLQQLIHQAELKHLEIQDRKEASKTRIIARGGGRNASLSIPEQIVLTLTYLRQHITFQILGLLFNVCESTANHIFHYWLPILQTFLPESLFAQLRDHESDWAVAQEILEQHELLIDSSEQERERPTDKQEQKKHYSGYKKNGI